jgi:HD-like signal output (HDOD) protein
MSVGPVRDAIQRVHELPTLPSSMAQILNAANDPDSSALDLGRFIAADQALTAAMLRLVNSSYFGFHRQISSVTTAIVILGFQEVRNLVFAASTLRTFPLERGGYDMRDLWRHSLASAMACERCSRLMRSPISDGPFIAGLLHDIGKVALVMLYPAEYGRMLTQAQLIGTELAAAEAAQFGCTHADVGGLLGEQWNLPDTVVEAIRLHHAPEQSSVEPRLAHLACVGDAIAYETGYGANKESAAALPVDSILKLGLTSDHLEHVKGKIAEAGPGINELIGLARD